MNASSSPQSLLLLVDGYNIIGTWSSLQSLRDHQGLESARRELVEALINYSALKGYDTQIVFDAQYQNTPAYRENFSSALSVYYTAFAQTADTYIEKTSDRAQRLMVIGYGAEWISAQKLATEVDQTKHRFTSNRRPQQLSRGRFLFHGLDAKSQKRLQDWRQGKL
jgi:uncharacterized protein